MLTRLSSLSLPHQAAVTAGFLVAYVALEWVSFIHEYKSVPITPWNPGLGVVFALMLLGGMRYSAVLFAGVVIAETTVLRTTLPWSIILGIAGIFALVYGAVAFVARERLRLDPCSFTCATWLCCWPAAFPAPPSLRSCCRC